MDNFALFWLIFGFVLMLLEFLLPGLVVIFLGAGAALVALGLSLGLIEGVLEAMTTWFISSIVLVVGLREALLKLAPTGDVTVAQMTDRIEEFGHVVTVVEEIGLEDGGRIFFQDTTWPAITEGKHIPKGSKARILTRLNFTYVVEPLGELEEVLDSVEGSDSEG